MRNFKERGGAIIDLIRCDVSRLTFFYLSFQVIETIAVVNMLLDSAFVKMRMFERLHCKLVRIMEKNGKLNHNV